MLDTNQNTLGGWEVEKLVCPNPACAKTILFLHDCTPEFVPEKGKHVKKVLSRQMIFPRHAARRSLSQDVSDPTVVKDYTEACAVLEDSPQASAALSRRCLQHILRIKGGFTQKDLAPAIDAAINSHTLPSSLSENIDAIRQVGNFAAHSLKDSATGSILPVETGEAEWTLEVLEDVIDFYFVRPAESQRRRDALNAKLKQANKPPLKIPTITTPASQGSPASPSSAQGSSISPQP